MGKTRDTKVAILPSTTRKGTTLSTSAALDSPSVIDKLVSPPHASNAGTSAESENSHNTDNISAVLDDSGSLGTFLDATIARSRQIENTETPDVTTPVNSPELEYSSDDLDEDYVELDDDFIEKCNATTDARKIKKLLAEHTVRYKLSPDPKFATSPINIRDKDYDFSLDLSHIAIVEKTPFCGTEKESAVEHMTELSTLSSLFSDDVKKRTYFVAKIFPFSLKDDAKTWYNSLPPSSIKSPKELLNVFFRKYFPASAQHAALQRVYNFDQGDEEKLPEAWARFCSLIRAQPDHDLEKHDLLDIFYSGLTIESRAYLDSCAGCVFRKRTPDEAEELLAKIGRNYDDWTTPEPTPTPIVKKRGLIKLNDEDMREAKKSLKEKGIKSEDVKNLPPIEDICEIIPPSSMIEILYLDSLVVDEPIATDEECPIRAAAWNDRLIQNVMRKDSKGNGEFGKLRKKRKIAVIVGELCTDISNRLGTFVESFANLMDEEQGGSRKRQRNDKVVHDEDDCDDEGVDDNNAERESKEDSDGEDDDDDDTREDEDDDNREDEDDPDGRNDNHSTDDNNRGDEVDNNREVEDDADVRNDNHSTGGRGEYEQVKHSADYLQPAPRRSARLTPQKSNDAPSSNLKKMPSDNETSSDDLSIQGLIQSIRRRAEQERSTQLHTNQEHDNDDAPNVSDCSPFSELRELVGDTSPTGLFSHEASKSEGETKRGHKWPTLGGAAPPGRAGCGLGPVPPLDLPFRLQIASVTKPPDREPRYGKHYRDAVAADPISGSEIASGTRRGESSPGGLYTAMVASE
ncbi:hypothetical protein QYE76_019952 [Lolium multiflorum]|uniref:Retrotransposon gag domain-containing protein n=1 Tax=Lolium multiflorum TaxID=4521 RepID=A0AAD8VRG5_LOLMU|nr:hypothetical protein QYE76_019952 [Lolium multiflorum]